MNIEKKNAAAAGPRNGANQVTKAAKLSPALYTEKASRATFFWDGRSNSVEPLAMRQAVPA